MVWRVWKKHTLKMALDIDDNRRGYASAGILPVCRINGVPHALLGREEYNRSKRWADFAGRKKATDTDVYATAAREFCEESVHTVHLNGVTCNSVEAVAEHLRLGNYILRVTIEKVSKGKRVVFVVLADHIWVLKKKVRMKLFWHLTLMMKCVKLSNLIIQKFLM